MPCFTAAEGAAVCGGSLIGSDINISRIWCCDSREVAEEGAFAAVRGSVTDGHLYIRKAVESGARLILAEKSAIENIKQIASEYPDVSFIVANDTEKALAAIAGAYLRRVSPRLVAITGSVGKTTTRELTAAVLRRHFKVHSAIKSFNTLIGCSLTILAMAEDTEVLVLEFGTNHFGEILEMANCFPPEIAVITEVVPCHLEGFGTLEGVLKAKTEICTSRSLKNIVYNADNALLYRYMSHNNDNIKKISVGKRADADVKIEESSVELNGGGPRTSAMYKYRGEMIELSSSLFGAQHGYNMGYALAVASLLGLSPQDIAAGIEALDPISGRGVCKRIAPHGWIIDEAYNANPASMGAAIKNTREAADAEGIKKTAVLAGMRELGESAPEWHKKIISELADFDDVKLLGSEWQCCEVLPENFRLYASIDDILAAMSAEDIDGRIILVKGSNSYGLKRVVSAFAEGMTDGH